MHKEPGVTWVVAIAVLGAYITFDHNELFGVLMLAITAACTDVLTSIFPLCGDGQCVARVGGGGTFWLDEGQDRGHRCARTEPSRLHAAALTARHQATRSSRGALASRSNRSP